MARFDAVRCALAPPKRGGPAPQRLRPIPVDPPLDAEEPRRGCHAPTAARRMVLYEYVCPPRPSRHMQTQALPRDSA